MCQWFAPTSIRLTFETEGKGKLSQEMIEQVAERDESGNVVSLKLPNRFILTANHQIYADWWYMWCLMYFIGAHRFVYITLKKSLQWVPIVGWVQPFHSFNASSQAPQGMQFFDFIFLARSWASDKHVLASRLNTLGEAAKRENSPLCFIIYPEGTLVSKDTRPISKKFADKTGISDMTNILLPRSLGLHYSLRSLAPSIPDLSLLDITIIYPGIPPLGYGQNYYTLRSIFFDGIAPPVIHMHLRLFKVTTDVPLGNLSVTHTNGNGHGVATHLVPEVDIPPAERIIFDEWLRELWKEKDEFITKHLNSGHAGNRSIDIPLKLRRKREYLDAFCSFLPAAGVYTWRWLTQWLY
ncbi:hypothetical protein AX14_000016 [Amanita brunnescens Koide BX004]|nr:hypothetical protein AX14_000016 [Amanita brunnescens Koide BX004]